MPACRTGERFETLFPAAPEGRSGPPRRRSIDARRWRRSALGSGCAWLEDWQYECRLGARGARLHYCDAFVSDHRHHSGAPLGLEWQTDDSAFLYMLAAHTQVLRYAQAADIDNNATEMRHFARNLSRLANAAGARGFDDRARELFRLTVTIDHRHRAEYNLFVGLVALLGWRHAARWTERVARLRRSTDARTRLIMLVPPGRCRQPLRPVRSQDSAVSLFVRHHFDDALATEQQQLSASCPLPSSVRHAA